MSIIPISNVINVSIETVPVGASEPNVNSVGLFTNETPNNINTYGIYVSASQVAADYGTNSVTAAMANAIFAQLPNILSGGGQLVIMPLLSAVSATSGYAFTASISANLAALQGVNNGDLKVTLNGVVNNLAGLNFTNAQSLSDIATILQQALPDATVTAQTNTITIASRKVGTSSTVALAAYSGGGTDLTGAGLLDTAAATITGGANSSGETILAAIARTAPQVQYAAVMTNIYLEDAAIEAIAAGIQAMDYIFLHQACTSTDIAGLVTTISSASETKTRILTYLQSQDEANLEKAAYVGRAFSVDFTGSNTAGTMNLQRLATITPDSNITQTLYSAANIAGTDIYVNYAGLPGIYSTKGNDFFDNVYSDLALKFALQTAGFNYLAQTNTKVPQTEQGMNGLKSAYAAVLKQFINNGEIAPGAWTSSETFGDPQIFNQNITNYGYYIFSTPVAQQSPTDRDDRIAPLVQIAIKRAGAIQSGNVIVLVNN